MKKPISQGRIKKPYILEEIPRNDNAGTDLEQVLQTQTLSERKPLRSLLYRVCLNLRATKGGTHPPKDFSMSHFLLLE